MNKMEFKAEEEEILNSTVVIGVMKPETMFDFDTPLNLVTKATSVQSACSSSQKTAIGSSTTLNTDSSVEFTLESHKVKGGSNQNKEQQLSEDHIEGDNINETKHVRNPRLENSAEPGKIESITSVNECNCLSGGGNLLNKLEIKLENSVENCVEENCIKVNGSRSISDPSDQYVIKMTSDNFLPKTALTLTTVSRMLIKDVNRKFKGCRSLRVVCTKIREVLPKVHVSEKSRKSRFPRFCEICEVTFSTKRKWDYHQRYKHNNAIKHYKCAICAYSTPYLSTFKRHNEMHEYRKLRRQAVKAEIITSHMCDKCGKCFVSRGNLLTHVRAHINPPSFQCNLCDKRFTQKGNLKTHLQHHQKREEKKEKIGEFSNANESRKFKPSSCKFCNKIFQWKGDLSRHIKTIHHGIKNFTCNVCCKQFADKTALRKHQLNHEGTKPFDCTHCDKCYTNKYNLEQHVSNRHTPK